MAFAGTTQKCMACDKTVYLVDKLTADNRVYHKACFRCHHCKGTLKVSLSLSLSLMHSLDLYLQIYIIIMIILHGYVAFDSSCSDLSVPGSGVSSWSSEQTSGINFSTCFDWLFCVFKIKHFHYKTLPVRTLTCSWYCCNFFSLNFLSKNSPGFHFVELWTSFWN